MDLIFTLDSKTRVFIGDAFETSGLWTKERPPQPCWTPIYEGGEVDEETGEVKGGEWIDKGPIAPTGDALAEQERAWRDAELVATDHAIWTAEDNGDDTAALRAYRQALRDYPQSAGFDTGERPKL